MSFVEPAYLKLGAIALAERAGAARELLHDCRLCPRGCRVDRTGGKLGTCRTDHRAWVSSSGPHFGEEPPLVGRGGSGTIFFTNCNLGCVFCQNFEISHLGVGSPVSEQELAGMMLSLQERGCHNINFVTPTHQVPQILEALRMAAGGGLRLPLVYNCGGYESVETLRLLDGVFDIYMPDAKYGDNAAGRLLSGVSDYWDRSREALAEMHRQVGDLVIEDGVAGRGLLVRHLVLPDGLAGTEPVTRFLASLSGETYLNLMDQYRPCHRASDYLQINRRPAAEEIRQAYRTARQAGLRRFAD